MGRVWKLERARRAAKRAVEALALRDAAIRDAAGDHSLREIAEATGLSKSRVGQITKKP